VPLDTPILLIAFNRPDTTRRVIQAIRRADPRRVYVAVDGPRHHVSGDRERVLNVHALAHELGTGCHVKTLFREHNLGCKRAVESAIDWFFENEPMGIVLEDDCLPNDSFFAFTSAMLLRYAGDHRVMSVSGSNPQRCCARSEHSYYFTKYMHCWGWASWRRAWRCNAPELPTSPLSDSEIIRFYPSSSAEIGYWRRRFAKVRAQRINSWDYGWQRSIWANGGLVVAPQVNMIENIGFGEGATHTNDRQDDRNLAVAELIVRSHPKCVEQHVAMDHHEAEHLYRFGQKTILNRIKTEWRSVLQQIYSVGLSARTVMPPSRSLP